MLRNKGRWLMLDVKWRLVNWSIFFL